MARWCSQRRAGRRRARGSPWRSASWGQWAAICRRGARRRARSRCVRLAGMRVAGGRAPAAPILLYGDCSPRVPASAAAPRRSYLPPSPPPQVVVRVRPPLPRELSSYRPYENAALIDPSHQVITLSENLQSLSNNGVLDGLVSSSRLHFWRGSGGADPASSAPSWQHMLEGPRPCCYILNPRLLTSCRSTRRTASALTTSMGLTASRWVDDASHPKSDGRALIPAVLRFSASYKKAGTLLQLRVACSRSISCVEE